MCERRHRRRENQYGVVCGSRAVRRCAALEPAEIAFPVAGVLHGLIESSGAAPAHNAYSHYLRSIRNLLYLISWAYGLMPPVLAWSESIENHVQWPHGGVLAYEGQTLTLLSCRSDTVSDKYKEPLRYSSTET